jgi:hypothetical protein
MKEERSHPDPVYGIGMRALLPHCPGRASSPGNQAVLSVSSPAEKKGKAKYMCPKNAAGGSVLETVHISPLPTLRRGYVWRLREARMEAARAWTLWRDLHLAAWEARTRWPTRDDLRTAYHRPVCAPQSDAPDDLPPIPGHNQDHAVTAPDQPPGPLPVQDRCYHPLRLP